MDLLLLGKEPIRADQPAGVDVRYDPAFEELQNEIDKLSSPVAAGTIDWGKVVRLASEILAQKSKDLLVASYLSVGLIYTRQIEGLTIGLKVYQELLEQFWENLFPPKVRMRARSGALEWWREKTAAALAPYQENPISPEKITPLKECLDKIDQFLREHLEQPPSLSPIRDFLRPAAPLPQEPAQQETPSPAEPEAAPEAAPAVVTRKAPEAGKAPVAEKISSSEDAQRGINFSLQKMREAAVFLREEALANPLAYRLLRMSVWSSVEALPPATNGRTRIPPPPAQVKKTLDDLRNKGQHEALLKAAEGMLAQYIFWIDLNRFAAETLIHLGEAYQGAQEMVCQETAFLLHRLAGLEDLTFSDGTPLADSSTKQWLKRIALRAGSASAENLTAASAPAGQDEDLMAKEIAEAQALAKQGKLLEAIERLQQKIRNSFSQRDRLLWRLALSQMVMASKQSKIVLPQLEQILKDIDLYRLEEYDPVLALKGLRLVWLGLEGQSDAKLKEKAADTWQRIARLDLCEVIRLGKG